MNRIYYTDGGCEPNPGHGTWAFVCVDPLIVISDFQPDTTSNRMEMIAVLRAIEHAIESRAESVQIFSDSQYVVKGFNDWMHNWKYFKWRKRVTRDEFEELKNADLWKELYKHKDFAKLTWIKGHAGNEYNELADDAVRTQYEATFGGQMKH